MTTQRQLIKNNNDYARGIRREAVVIAALRERGWEVREATRQENMKEDIDAIRTMRLPQGVVELPISIKSVSPHTFRKSGSILFEIEVLDRYSMRWYPSWFLSGKARAYIVDVGEEHLYYISKPKLEQYVKAHGWQRTTQNTPDTVTKQYVSGHSHLDAYSGLLKLSTMVKEGIAFPMG